MNSFRVAAIPTEIAQTVRSTMKAPVYGFPVHKEIAAGRAPCRHCLRLIRANEEALLLFTYDPFRELGVLPLPGPVYVHAEECERYASAAGFPEEYSGRLLTLNAYGADRKLLSEVRVQDGAEAGEMPRLFANPEVLYVHVRSTEAGCYLFRMERV